MVASHGDTTALGIPGWVRMRTQRVSCASCHAQADDREVQDGSAGTGDGRVIYSAYIQVIGVAWGEVELGQGNFFGRWGVQLTAIGRRRRRY